MQVIDTKLLKWLHTNPRAQIVVLCAYLKVERLGPTKT